MFYSINDGIDTPIPASANVDEEAAELDADWDQGGHPVGTTIKKREHNESCYIVAKHEIVEIYNTNKNTLGKKRAKVDRLDEIITKAKERNALPHDFKVNKSLIRQGLKKNMFVYAPHGGHTSPLA